MAKTATAEDLRYLRQGVQVALEQRDDKFVLRKFDELARRITLAQHGKALAATRGGAKGE